MTEGHKAKTGSAPIRKVGHTTGARYGQNASAKPKGNTGGSEQSYK
jgi:hypothetical protein